MSTNSKLPKSKQGCARQILAIIASYKRDFAGGGSFGWDWPTFARNAPERAARVRQLRELYDTLPLRRTAR